MALIEGYQEAVGQRTLSQFTTDDRRACIDFMPSMKTRRLRSSRCQLRREH